MAVGPGKYDDVCTEVRERFKADGAMVLIINGSRGSGHSMQLTVPHMAILATQLRVMADALEEDVKTILEGAVTQGAQLLKTATADEGKPQ